MDRIRQELREYINQELVEHPIDDFIHHSNKVAKYHMKSEQEVTNKYDKKIDHHVNKASKIYKKHNLQNYFGGGDHAMQKAITLHALRKDPEIKQHFKFIKGEYKRHQKKIKVATKLLKKQGVKVPKDAPFNFQTRYVSQKEMDKMQKDPAYADRKTKKWMKKKG